MISTLQSLLNESEDWTDIPGDFKNVLFKYGNFRPTSFNKQLALETVAHANGFVIIGDLALVHRAIHSLETDDAVQSTWSKLEAVPLLKHIDQILDIHHNFLPSRPAFQDYIAAFFEYALHTILQPSGWNITVKEARRLPSVHSAVGTNLYPQPDLIVTLRGVLQLGAKLGDEAPHALGIIIEEVDREALTLLVGARVTATGRWMHKNSGRVTKRIQAAEKLLLRVFASAVEFNLSYIVVADRAQSIFIHVRDRHLTLGPCTRAKAQDPHNPKPSHVSRPPNSSIPSTSSSAYFSSDEQPSLTLAYIAILVKAISEKDWSADGKVAKLPGRRYNLRKRKAELSPSAFTKPNKKKQRVRKL